MAREGKTLGTLDDLLWDKVPINANIIKAMFKRT